MKPYDIEAFARSMDASPEDLLPLMSSFVEEGRSEMALLEEAINKGELPMVKSIAHNLKGISANLEMDDFFVWCKEMDTAAKAGDTLKFTLYLNEMKSAYKMMEEKICSYYNL